MAYSDGAGVDPVDVRANPKGSLHGTQVCVKLEIAPAPLGSTVFHQGADFLQIIS